MNFDPQVRDVYGEHGAAISEAQLLENYLGYAIVAAQDLASSESLASEMALVSRRSMGQLIRRLRELIPIASSFDARLDMALERRNWLAHRYFSDRAMPFQTESGRAEMIRELDEIGEEFYQLWGYLDTAIVSWLRRPSPTTAMFVEDFIRAVAEA
jgi:hypothetical protein